MDRTCVCGHAPEEHGSGFLRSCEEDGCLCACYEPEEDEESQQEPSA